MTSSVAEGLTKLAVPISTADAPAIRNSKASRPSIIPPRPITGILTDLAVCQTILTAIGRMHGPERPPVTVLNTGRLRSTSMAIPRNVLTNETESAPVASTARAISVMSVTLGESFTIRCLSQDSRAAEVTFSAPEHVVPNAMPPCFTFGQEMLISTAFTRSKDERRRHTSA